VVFTGCNSEEEIQNYVDAEVEITCELTKNLAASLAGEYDADADAIRVFTKYGFDVESNEDIKEIRDEFSTDETEAMIEEGFKPCSEEIEANFDAEINRAIEEEFEENLEEN
jgi:hypothetical protein